LGEPLRPRIGNLPSRGGAPAKLYSRIPGLNQQGEFPKSQDRASNRLPIEMKLNPDISSCQEHANLSSNENKASLL
jgi:hypothetical protein